MTDCPMTLGDFNPKGWHSTLYGRKTPDYFSLCSKDQEFSSPKSYIINVKPFKGESYVGLVGFNPNNGYREYITTQLISSLEKGVKYEFSISISQPELSLYYIDNLGVIFTADSLNHYKVSSTILSDADIDIVDGEFLECRKSWTTYRVRFIAKGGEEYLHLGCFLTDEKLLYRTYKDRKDFCNKTGYHDAYYLFDEVSLKKVAKESTEEVAVNELINSEPKKRLYLMT